MATVLDPRLARGVAPESGHLLASRAAHLVDPRNLASLADAWGKLIERSTPSRTAVDPRVPVARNAVRAAANEITALAAALRRGSPVQARDVARATVLLTESDSPVYTGRPGLRTAVVELTDAIISGDPPSND